MSRFRINFTFGEDTTVEADAFYLDHHGVAVFVVGGEVVSSVSRVFSVELLTGRELSPKINLSPKVQKLEKLRQELVAMLDEPLIVPIPGIPESEKLNHLNKIDFERWLVLRRQYADAHGML